MRFGFELNDSKEGAWYIFVTEKVSQGALSELMVIWSVIFCEVSHSVEKIEAW
jgi:hypothetical protein